MKTHSENGDRTRNTNQLLLFIPPYPIITKRGARQVLTQKGWTDSRYEGIALRRIFKRLTKKAKMADEHNDIESLIAIAKTMGYVAQAKGTLAKLERELEIEKRLEALEKVAGLAAKQVITQ